MRLGFALDVDTPDDLDAMVRCGRGRDYPAIARVLAARGLPAGSASDEVGVDGRTL